MPDSVFTLLDRPPAGGGWAHEVKFDGYRMEAIKTGTTVRLLSRNQGNYTSRFRQITEAVAGRRL